MVLNTFSFLHELDENGVNGGVVNGMDDDEMLPDDDGETFPDEDEPFPDLAASSLARARSCLYLNIVVTVGIRLTTVMENMRRRWWRML